KEISAAWQTKHDQIVNQGEKVMGALQQHFAHATTETNALERGILERGFKELAQSFDEQEGGFGRAPKFPRPVTLNFLFRIAAREGKTNQAGKQALEMSLLTLQKMAAGGIHDHLSGGFHRYSVERFWHVPHFEKMLYDQAQLAGAYLD